jgi:syntaxin 5
MTGPSIQDRTSEFSAIIGHAQKRLGASKVGTQRQALLTDAQRRQANGSPSGAQDRRGGRSEFARTARDIGKGITGTTAKLQRLAECELLGLEKTNHRNNAARSVVESRLIPSI